MSVIEQIQRLNLSQLKNVEKEAKRLIEEIETQEKHLLYIVQGSAVNEACYREDEFDKAKEKLCEVIMSDDFDPRDVKFHHPVITAKRVPESEVDEWMSIN